MVQMSSSNCEAEGQELSVGEWGMGSKCERNETKCENEGLDESENEG